MNVEPKNQNDDICIICLESFNTDLESNIVCNVCKCRICTSCNQEYLSYNYNTCPKCRTHLSVFLVNFNNTQEDNSFHGIPQYDNSDFKTSIFYIILFFFLLYLSYLIGVSLTGRGGMSWIFINIFLGAVTISLIIITLLYFFKICFTSCRH